MNDYYYRFFIRPFIPSCHLKILNRLDLWIMGKKKFLKEPAIHIKILLHRGYPCFRYCICNVLTKEDLITYYESNYSKII